MSKRDELHAQMAALQKEIDGLDDGDEVWVEHSGRTVRLKGADSRRLRATPWWQELFGDEETPSEEETATAESANADGDGQDDADKAAESAGRYWGRGQR